MKNLFNNPGFLGTNANFLSDTILILILVTMVLFTIGWQLAVRKHYRSHRRLQTFAVVLNTLLTLGTMIKSYIIHILPGIPDKLFEGSYGLTTVHAVVGMGSLLLGVFIVLQGHELIPERIRIKNFKMSMRISYVFYLTATFTGVFIYIIVFVYGI